MEGNQRTPLDDAFRLLLDKYHELTGVESYGTKKILSVGFRAPKQDGKIIGIVTGSLYSMIRGSFEKCFGEKRYRELLHYIGFIQGAVWALGLRSFCEIQQDNTALATILRKTELKND